MYCVRIEQNFDVVCYSSRITHSERAELKKVSRPRNFISKLSRYIRPKWRCAHRSSPVDSTGMGANGVGLVGLHAGFQRCWTHTCLIREHQWPPNIPPRTLIQRWTQYKKRWTSPLTTHHSMGHTPQIILLSAHLQEVTHGLPASTPSRTDVRDELDHRGSDVTQTIGYSLFFVCTYYNLCVHVQWCIVTSSVFTSCVVTRSSHVCLCMRTKWIRIEKELVTSGS